MNDLTPLLRAAIGFDRMAAHIEAARSVRNEGYPPYNIEALGTDEYRIAIAVAGFAPADVEINVQDGFLNIQGAAPKSLGSGTIFHRGISGRPFRLQFALYEHVTVEGAEMADGLLSVKLRRVVPEALKPRRIEIRSAEARNLVEAPPMAEAA